jgi:hypothetical protein
VREPLGNPIRRHHSYSTFSPHSSRCVGFPYFTCIDDEQSHIEHSAGNRYLFSYQIYLDPFLCESDEKVVHMSNPSRHDVASVFELLSRSRCRYTACYFLKNQHTSIERLSRQITAWEQECPPDAVSEAERRRVMTSLIHHHLPRLAEHGLLKYDRRSGDVTSTATFESMREEIRRVRTLDDGPVPDEEPLDSVLYAEPLTEGSTTPSE